MSDEILPRTHESTRTAAACANCGTLLIGDFCHVCGQRAVHGQLSFRRFVTSAVGDLFHLDSKLLRTLRRLVFHPGSLTGEFARGRRVHYIQPLQLYLLAASIFFVICTYRPIVRFDTTAREVRSSLNAVKVGGIMSAEKVRDLADRGVSIELFRERFSAGVNRHLPTFLIGSVLLFSVGLAAVYYRARRPFLGYAVFALHWSAFYLLLMSVALLMPRRPGNGNASRTLDLVFFAIAWAYLFRALRNVYDASPLAALARSALLFLWFNVLLALWVTSVIVWALETI